MARPTSRWAMAKRVTESIISSTSWPLSRKCSAIEVAVSAALMRTSAGWSEVATTTTEWPMRVAEVALDELAHLAATLADEADDVDVGRRRAGDHAQQRRLADAGAGEDAQALAAPAGDHAVQRRGRRAPTRSRMRGRSSGIRRGAGGRAHAAVGQLLALVDRAAEAVEHAAQQLVADGDADGLAGGGDDVAGADAVQLAERHEQRAALAEADDLGRDRRRGRGRWRSRTPRRPRPRGRWPRRSGR